MLVICSLVMFLGHSVSTFYLDFVYELLILSYRPNLQEAQLEPTKFKIM